MFLVIKSCNTCSNAVFRHSSSHMCVINHNWSATKQRLHPQSVAEISRHSVLSWDRIRQCDIVWVSPQGHRSVYVAISFCRHRCNVPVPCENSSAETTVVEGGRNPVAGIETRSFGIDTALQSFCHLFVALSMIRCSKSVQKSAVRCVKSLLLLWKPHSWF